MSPHPVINLVSQLTELLTGGQTTSEQVVRTLGQVFPFPGTGVRVTPNDPNLSRADVFTDPQTGRVIMASVTLAETTEISLAELASHFGPSEVIGSINLLEDGSSAIIPMASKQMSLIANNRDFFDMTEDSMIQKITVRLD
jgi:hypothetical protein